MLIPTYALGYQHHCKAWNWFFVSSPMVHCPHAGDGHQGSPGSQCRGNRCYSVNFWSLHASYIYIYTYFFWYIKRPFIYIPEKLLYIIDPCPLPRFPPHLHKMQKLLCQSGPWQKGSTIALANVQRPFPRS
jgi:hypothetical protein